MSQGYSAAPMSSSPAVPKTESDSCDGLSGLCRSSIAHTPRNFLRDRKVADLLGAKVQPDLRFTTGPIDLEAVRRGLAGGSLRVSGALTIKEKDFPVEFPLEVPGEIDAACAHWLDLHGVKPRKGFLCGVRLTERASSEARRSQCAVEAGTQLVR